MNPEEKNLSAQDREDIHYMKMALGLAAKGRGHTNPNPMVGAVIVKDGEVIARGYHHKCGQGHAEVEAFRDAGDADVTGATMYVSLEPCSHYGKTPPCADLIVSKKIGRVVVAALDPNPLVAGRGIEKLRAAGIEVKTGVLADESIRLNEIFMHYIVHKDPYVLFKAAVSLDGKIATRTGDSQWISCEESRAEVQQLRNQYMAIMVGSNTAIQDNPRLTCRLPGGVNPIRIVVDSRLRIPETLTLVQTARETPTVVACLKGADPAKIKRLETAGVQVMQMDEKNGHVDLAQLCAQLGQQGIDSILLEGGGTIADAAFRSGIVDKVQIYSAPMIIGGSDAKTAVGGLGAAKLSEAVRLRDMSFRRVGSDLCITAFTDREA